MKRPMATRRRKKLIPPSWHRWLSKRWQLLRGHWWFHWGVFALWRGRYQKAAQWLERALSILGEDAFVRMQLSWAHWHLGHPVTARLHALRATEQLPHHAPAWVFAGKVLALRGKWGEAERALRQALLLSPQNFVASSWLALVLFQTQQPEEALQLLKPLPVVDEPYLQARLVLHLERLVSERGKGDGLPLSSPPRWMRWMGSLFGWLCRWRGERLLEDGAWDAGAKWLHFASQLRPNDLWARILLTIALIEGGHCHQAENFLAQIPQKTPEARLLTGILWARQRRPFEALAALDGCDPHHPLVRYYTALAWHWLGETERACISYLEPLYREDPASLRVRLKELLRRLNES